ncbi:MAG TPA: aminoacetone oxidase family FAD-binding enzyme [Clostridiales bacterium]|nr:NAD(P)/FAD-dependent oxidoreductase [Clostridia bacterium]HCF65311.1 aminoacetone oxidase family FAD-binding enzyme [Clostridiales bacterium]
MKVVIIGGGPAGMLSAISAGTNKNDVTILEKMNMLGRKLLITGKGRCNITSSISIDEFIKNVPGNGKFLYSCLNNFTNEDILNILKEEGLQTKVERGNRVFPITDKSQDVLQALLNRLKKLKVKIEVGANVKEILTEQDIVSGVKYIQGGKEKILKADKVILATGGKSYSATGSTGDGYELAKKVGHTVTEIKPSLVPISTKGKDLEICRRMQGLSLKNVAIKIKDAKNNKIIYEDFGEMIFTHFGVSGPVILSGSAHLLRYKKEDIRQGNIKLIIDLKPALDVQKLDDRILRDFSLEKNKIFKNSLDNLLPQKMISTVIELSGIDQNKKVNEITREERVRLVQLLKNFEITLHDFRPIEEAIITAGGISIKEINPKTMESKLIKGLYFAGEIIDVDAYTGGFNLQIAYSTGYTAGGATNV